MAAMIDHRRGHGAHQAVAAASVNEADFSFRHVPAKLRGGGLIGGIEPGAGPAINTETFGFLV